MLTDEIKATLEILQKRFTENMHRHVNIDWQDVHQKLTASKVACAALAQMEASKGEPDVILYDEKTNQYIFADCAKESPKGRRSICYDEDARLKRKKYPPKSSVEALASEMGVEVMDEKLYRHLQTLEAVDLKTSSWIKTPDEIRTLGGAIFADRRYDTIFIYHNSADSYYGSRGFRAYLEV